MVAFRKHLLDSVFDFIFMGAFPLIGSAFMFWIFGESIPQESVTVIAIGLGAMALGLIPLGFYLYRGSAYLRERPTLGRTRVEAGVGIGADPANQPAGTA